MLQLLSVAAGAPVQEPLPFDYWVWDWQLLVGSLVFIIGGSMSASVGIGGGGIYVPVLVLICGFLPKEAIPLSKVAIFGVALSSFIVNIPKRHPKADRPLIDYGLAAIMMPTTALGTVIGITLYVIFPQWLILVLLVLVLGLTVYRTFVKGLELYRKETKELEAAARQVNSEEKAPLMSETFSEEHPNGGGGNEALNQLRQKMSRIPIYKIMYMLFLWLCMFLLIYIRGGGEGAAGRSPVGIEKCTVPFWLLGVVIIVFLVLGSSISSFVHHRTQKQLDTLGEPKVDGDIKWTIPKYAAFMAVGCFAGICAGFLGIGAGMINVPFMLEVGLKPEVAAATSSFMIIFTAMSTVSQYLLIGALPGYLALWYAGVGLVAAVIGQFAVGAIVARYKKSSIISFILAGVIAISMVGLTVLGIIRIVNLAKSGGSFGFEPYCT